MRRMFSEKQIRKISNQEIDNNKFVKSFNNLRPTDELVLGGYVLIETLFEGIGQDAMFQIISGCFTSGNKLYLYGLLSINKRIATIGAYFDLDTESNELTIQAGTIVYIYDNDALSDENIDDPSTAGSSLTILAKDGFVTYEY